MYPLVKKCTVLGLLTGVLAALLFGSLLAGFSFFVVFFSAGLVWRANESPVLSFALAFQWVFIVAGYLYTLAGGTLRDYALIGKVDLAVLLALLGLVCVAIGLRLGLAIPRWQETQQSESRIDLTTLFWATVITYSISWIVEISPMDIFFNAAQVLYGILTFREVLLCLLWLVILRRRQGYHYGVIAFLIALLPRFISRQSTFKELIFMLLVVSLAEFKPWIKTGFQRAWNRRIIVSLGITCVGLVIAGVIWEGAVKPVWRTLEFEGTPLETLDAFAQVTVATTSEMDEERGLQAFISRLSSITQFALVLDRVPDVVAFENGRLTKRAIIHILVPRLLYPAKEALGSDSLLAEEYAGLTIGEDTSVGIGYMAEFYVDWGIGGMLASLVVLGVFFGLAYRLIFFFSPTHLIANAVVIVPFIGNFITFEATLPKMLGGFIMNTLILLLLSRAIPRMVREKVRPVMSSALPLNELQATRRPTPR